ncbi:hypothetical protein [Candidatus Nitrospira bockiana]
MMDVVSSIIDATLACLGMAAVLGIGGWTLAAQSTTVSTSQSEGTGAASLRRAA